MLIIRRLNLKGWRTRGRGFANEDSRTPRRREKDVCPQNTQNDAEKDRKEERI
jgi:hypothetical protein